MRSVATHRTDANVLIHKASAVQHCILSYQHTVTGICVTVCHIVMCIPNI